MFVVRNVIPTRGSVIGVVLFVTFSCGAANDDTQAGGNGGTRTIPAAGGTLGTGGAPVGGVSTGGTSTLAAGATGGSSLADTCGNLDYDHCVTDCFEESVLVENATCANSAWSCRAGYVLASSCPQQACGVTPDGCCDMTTGIVTWNPCNTDGFRQTCPDGAAETNRDGYMCVP